MAMTKSGNSMGRLLPLLAIIALLPFSFLSCTKAGDEPEVPTGPGSTYNPEMDTPGAKIAVYVDGNATPGVKFALSAAFTDGAGRPVQGIPLTVWAETGTGAVAAYFSFEANPNITDEQGRISTHITPAADCPNGSYRFVVSSAPGGDGPVNGPYARGYGGVYVGGVGTAAVTTVSLTTVTPTVELVAGSGNAVFQIAAVYTASCTLQITYDAVGVGYAASNVLAGEGLLNLPVATTGTLVVQATGLCTEDPTTTVVSSAVSVTVQDLVP